MKCGCVNSPPKAQSGYIRTVSLFYGWLGRSPDTATVESLRRYQLHLVDHGISPISLNVTITGLKFFFDSTLDRPELMRHIHPVHTPRKIPVVLSPEEVALLIGAAGSLRNQTALSFAYGAGLRVSEVVALKVNDIDSHSNPHSPSPTLTDSRNITQFRPSRLVRQPLTQAELRQ